MIYKQETILLLFLITNILSLSFMIIDKRKSIKGKFRIAEKFFFYNAILGGWLITWVMIPVLKHKNRKSSFKWKLFLSTILNITIIYIIITLY